MKIGLVDVDGHAKKKKWGATIYPNLALCKIARYHKQHGDTVEWAFSFEHYDVVYMSKVFNFSPDDMTCYNADRIVKGGTGYDIASRLPDEIDRLQPDYSIYPNIPTDTAYGFLTRGCPNRCPWCVVPRKEGAIHPYMDVDEIAIEGRKKLVLMDNNILAAGDYAVSQMEKIISRGYRVDFNQALDARLVTDRFARLLAKIRWIDRRIRFGCDTHGQIAECERAIEMINGYGYLGEYFLYTMIGGKSDFLESYERVNYWWHRNHEQREKHLPNIYPYAQPYRNPDNPREPVPEWQKDMARWVNKHQCFQMTDFYNFEPRKGFKCKEYFKERQHEQRQELSATAERQEVEGAARVVSAAASTVRDVRREGAGGECHRRTPQDTRGDGQDTRRDARLVLPSRQPSGSLYQLPRSRAQADAQPQQGSPPTAGR